MVVRIIIGVIVVFFLVLWIRAVIDAWRRPDLSGAARAAWTIIMLIFPFIGILLYYMIRPSDEHIARG